MSEDELIERVTESHKWDLQWDYKPHKLSSDEAEYSQNDWNQVLMTKVNQISAQIHMSCLRGPATKVIVHSYLEPLFATLEYYNFDKHLLCSRYDVIFTSDIEENTIYVVAEEWLDSIIIPRANIGDTTINEDGEQEIEISEVEFHHITSDELTPEEIVEFRDKLIGRIKVVNY